MKYPDIDCQPYYEAGQRILLEEFAQAITEDPQLYASHYRYILLYAPRDTSIQHMSIFTAIFRAKKAGAKV